MGPVYYRISSENGTVTALNLSSQPGDERADGDVPVEVRQQIDEFLAGLRKTFSFPFDYDETRFAGKVFSEVRSIPYGETLTYADVAERLGNRKKARAVGNALSKNRLLIIIPCHRVIRTDGSIGGYSAGACIKQKLLAMESGCPYDGQL